MTPLAIAGLAPARWNLPQTSVICGSPAALGAKTSSSAPSPHLAEVSAMIASTCSSVAPHEMSESVRKRGVDP